MIAWIGEGNGLLFARSAYRGHFVGRTEVAGATKIWKSRAPSTCKFFAWLAFMNRCWTSDRLAKRGLPHQEACPFCDQEEESINHILLTCVFARMVWAEICQALGKLEWVPSEHDSLTSWVCHKSGTNKGSTKDLRTIIGLTLWELWKHCNVLYGLMNFLYTLMIGLLSILGV